jgi:hypothetical protein
MGLLFTNTQMGLAGNKKKVANSAGLLETK